MKITEKLMNVQQELKAPKGQYNAFGKYKYRSCEDIQEAVKPLLKANRLALTLSDEIICVNGNTYIHARATLSDADSDETVVVTANARESADKKGMDASQITGTASSYARKYALNGLFAIDDAKDADTNEFKYGEQQAEYAAYLPCADCKQPIQVEAKRDGTPWSIEDQAAYSENRYGRKLCKKCMKKAEAELKG